MSLSRPPPVELPDVGLFGAMRRYGSVTIHAVVDLGRAFAHDELVRAMTATLEDFPVLAHRYAPGLRRDRWVLVAGPPADAVHDEVVADLEASTADWVRRPIVATRDRQVRLVALRHGGRFRFVLSVTHVAVDGAGVAAVAHVLGAHLYGVPTAVPVAPRRDVWHALAGLRWFHWPVVAKAMAQAALRPLAHFLSAPRERPYPRAAEGQATFRHLEIPKERLDALRRRCGGATVNDVLLAAMARVAGGRAHDGPVVVTYTMDLRRYGEAPRLTAANQSSILTVVVPREALGDIETATRAVSERTKRDRDTLAGPAFVLAPYLLGAGVPHAAARIMVELLCPLLVDLPLDRGLLVTNVGRIDDGLRAFGDDIESVRIVGPDVRGMPVPVVVAFGFRGALHLDLFAGPDLAERALDELAHEIEGALGAQPGP
jgi:NRPS condensation-like uncharacterized protein